MNAKAIAQAFVLSFMLCGASYGAINNDSIVSNPRRLRIVAGSELALGTASLAGLYQLWYRNYPMGKFHWLNDNDEWLMMDKIGHSTTSYHLGSIGYDLLRWAGADKQTALLYGSTLGFVYLGAVEVMDGFSEGWGASWGDLAANTLGTALQVSQTLAWDEQRLLLKWSFHRSRYSEYRPELLGSNIFQEVLKDYNGQTYWLSANINSFIPASRGVVPPWLNICFGYGAEGMVGAAGNPPPWEQISRYREYYLSFDIDLARIHTRSAYVNSLLRAMGFLKIPFPALGYNPKEGLTIRPLYF